MKYAVKMGSAAVIYSTKFHKHWFRRSKVTRRGVTQREEGVLISLL
jgi:hypothetical protein